MRTFCIHTLGCKVNQYESEQIACLLRKRGLAQVADPAMADLRIVNTCSVTIQAASKSRQAVRQAVGEAWGATNRDADLFSPPHGSAVFDAGVAQMLPPARHHRTIVTGCWATSDPMDARRSNGVSAVIGHDEDVATQLEQLLNRWQSEDSEPPAKPIEPTAPDARPESSTDDGWMIPNVAPAALAADSKTIQAGEVKEKSGRIHEFSSSPSPGAPGADGNEGPLVSTPLRGTSSLPLLDEHQTGHQRAFLKIQDGCDAHCTYCIIPRLRPALWSKPVEQVIQEAQRLVDSGHREIVLTGIFLGAYGRQTALRRRQNGDSGARLAGLIEALCSRVRGPRRLRLSSLEPGDLDEQLLAVLRSHPQTVPHFHLPLQSGSDRLLRRMNRQYGREDYMRMIGRVREAFDRPAITTDIIVGFPGEDDAEFERTMDLARFAGFIHIHAFPFSPRPGTAAARWGRDFVRGPIINERIESLRELAARQSLDYRSHFLGSVVEVLVERPASGNWQVATGNWRYGRCERYFTVHFEHDRELVGKAAKVRIVRVTPSRTLGELVGIEET